MKYINNLNFSTANVYKLLENLLDWAMLQFEKTEIHKEQINLRSLTDEIIALLSAVANNKNILVQNDVSETIFVNADLNSLRTILRNLVNNSLKYTQNGGNVTISTKPLVNGVEITIRDTGVGMDAGTIGSLFKIEESKSTPGTNKEKGTGLGLILCKELISRNGGEISVESESGRGSLFKVSLPS